MEYRKYTTTAPVATSALHAMMFASPSSNIVDAAWFDASLGLQFVH